MIDYDSFSRCHLTDIFFRFSRGAKELTLFKSSLTEVGGKKWKQRTEGEHS